MSRHYASAEDRLRVPVLLPTGRDAELVTGILERQRIAVVACNAMSELLDHLRGASGPFVVGDEALSPDAVFHLVRALEAQPDWSDLPGIILTGAAGRKQFLESLAKRPEISLIQRPVKISVFLNLVRTALEARQRQYQVRGLMQDLIDTNEKLRSRSDLLQKLSLELTRAENRERRRIAQLLHDDLQQMLASARLQTELLMDEVHGGSAHKAHTVFDILTQAMEAARNLSHELNPDFAIAGNLGEALQKLGRRMADSYGFDVRCRVGAENAAIHEDVRIFVYRSVQELFLNCAKHAGARRVSLEIRSQDNLLTIVVADDGDGFTPDSLTIQGGSKGGLGLFSIQERATALGGSLEIQSAPGQGSRFQLRVPETLPDNDVPRGDRKDQEGQASPAPVGAPAKAAAKAIAVMIADDHAVMRQGLAALLRSSPGIDVVAEAADGEQAVTLALQLQPQVVLMDFSMPLLNGAEATRQIKRRAPGIAVIGLSMYGDRQTQRHMLAAGAQAYLSKDVQAGDLIAAIQDCIRKAGKAPGMRPTPN